MADWEKVLDGPFAGASNTYRLKVPGGWLYRYGEKAMEFVPALATKAHPAPAQAVEHAFPVMRRSVSQVPGDVIDVEYTEIPAAEVNGSKVIDAVKVDA